MFAPRRSSRSVAPADQAPIAGALREQVFADTIGGLVRTRYGRRLATTYSGAAKWLAGAFDIPSGYAQVANSASEFVDLSKPFAITIRWRTGSSLTNQHLLASSSAFAGGRSIRIAYNSSTTLQFLLSDGSGSWADDTITVPTWQANTDYVMTVRYTRSPSNIKDVIIGQAKYSFATIYSLYPNTPPNVQLGAESGTNSFSGRIYSVLYWDEYPADAVVRALHARYWDSLYPSERAGIWLPDAVGGGDTGLVIADATHGHAADGLTLGVTGSTDLSIADALHAHAADSLALSSSLLLSVADALHAHLADNVELSNAPILIVADATHGHAADNVSLSLATWLVIAEALHAHLADSLTLGASGETALSVADAWHAHRADVVTLALVADRIISAARQLGGNTQATRRLASRQNTTRH